MSKFTSEWLAEYEAKQGPQSASKSGKVWGKELYLLQEKMRQGESEAAIRGNKPRVTAKKNKTPTWSPDLTIKALTNSGLPCPVTEHRFHPVRRWRFDLAWTEQLIALEVEGGAYTKGRHTRGSGFIKDMEKYNTAAALGWVVLRCIPKWLPGKYGMAIDGQLLDQLTRLFNLRQAA